MKAFSRRSFLKTTFTAGAAAALASQASLFAGAAAPSDSAAAESENCLTDLLGLNSDQPIEVAPVQLSAGTLAGFKDGDLYTFRGIPYATAERFQDPVPVTSYTNGIQMALTYGPVCPQDNCLNGTGKVNVQEFRTPSNGTANMVANETCQYLNVWTSSLEGKKPVIVFFHGGGLTNGASTELSYYTGEYFAQREDAVFVSINHRLNVLGYLDLSPYSEKFKNSGIVGTRDCVCALQWVHDNISAFGGDPSNVTIVGQSGGGVKVTTLACMSDTVDLFNKVFVMSGGYSTGTKAEGIANGKKLVDYLGLTDAEVVEKLPTMRYEELLEAATAAGCTWSTYVGDSTFTAPLLDANGTVNPYAAQRKWMVGTAFSEFNGNSGLILRFDWSDFLPDISDEDAVARLNQKYGSRTDAVVAEFRKAYPDHRLAEALYLNTQTSGCMSRWDLIRPNGILDQLANAGLTVYNYIDTYKFPYFGGITMHHSGDIGYWFYALDCIGYQVKGDEKNAYAVSGRMADALAAFAASGNPSTRTLKWPVYTAGQHNTMVFDTKTQNKVDFDKALYQNIMNV